MRICPTCLRSYDQALFCPQDGSPLVADPAEALLGEPPLDPDATADDPPTGHAWWSPGASGAAPPLSGGGHPPGLHDTREMLAVPAPLAALAAAGEVDDEPPTAASPRRARAAAGRAAAGRGEDLCGRIIDERYRIVEFISAGGGGEVYRGEHVQLHRPVAVKILHEAYRDHDDYVQRFQREARAASRISHPACVAVLDYGACDGRPYLVMEYVEGIPLSWRLRDGPLPLPHAVLLMRLLLGALRHAHRLGIVHRDIKPGNVMLCSPEVTGVQLKLLDFGLAKSLNADDVAGRGITIVGTVCGSPGYMSPEQAAGLPLDARSDLYAAAALLFHALTGQRLFQRENAAAEIRAHVHELPPPVRALRPEVSVELEAVLARALAREPDARFQTADELIAALAATPEGQGVVTPVGDW